MNKVKSLIMVVAILLASMESLPVMASLDTECIQEIIKQQEEFRNIGEFITYTENKSDYKYIEKKINIESGNDILDKRHHEIEEFLNDSGVFDEEIDLHFTEEMLNELEETKIDNISIMSAYYAVDDSCTDEDTSNEKEILGENNMVRLDEQEVNKYLAQKYFEKETDIYDEMAKKLEKSFEKSKEISLKDKIMQAIGIEPIEVFAESHGGGNVTMLKKTVIAYKVDTKYARVQVWFDWTDMPNNRNLDTIGIKIYSGQYERDASKNYDKVTARHEYYKIVKDGPIGCKGKKDKVSYDMKNSSSQTLQDGEYHAVSNGITAAVKLVSNESKLKPNGDVYSEEIRGESVYFNFYVRLVSLNKNYLEVDPTYLHVKKQASILKLAKVTIDLAKGNVLNVVFFLSSNKIVNVDYEYSGDDRSFELILNFK